MSAVAPGGRSGRPWRAAISGNVLMMGLVSLFTDFSSEMMNPLLPIFVAGLVQSPALVPIYVGLMEGIAEAAASLLKIVSGRTSDRLRKRKALVVFGYGASSISRPLMALAGLGWSAAGGVQVIVLKFLDRVGKGFRTSPRDALIGDSVPAEVRGLAFSFHRALDHAGAVLGPAAAIAVLCLLIGPALWGEPAVAVKGRAVGSDQMAALRWLFALALVPGLAAMAALVFKVREIAPPPRPASGAVGGPAPGAGERLPRRFYVFVGIVTLFALGNSSDAFIVWLAASRFGMSLLEVLALWIVFHVSKIAFSIPGGVLADRLGRRPMIVAGWIIYSLAYFGFAFADRLWQFWALMPMYGFYYGLSEGAERALVTDFVPSRRRGTAFGVYHGAIGLAAFPASIVFGLFWSRIGATFAFSLGGALAGAAAVLLIVLLSASRKGNVEG